MFDQRQYIEDYKKSNYDQIKIYAPKGYKAHIKELAAIKGQSMTQWILDAIDEHAAHQEDAYTRKD